MVKFGLFILILLGAVPYTQAQEAITSSAPAYYYATVTDVAQEEPTENEAEGAVTVTARLTNGPHKGESITTSWENTDTSRTFQVDAGDRIIVTCSTVNSELTCGIVDLQRSRGLLMLAGLFLITLWFIARKHGLMAFIGLLFGLFVIVSAVIPLILQGMSPLLVTILAGLVIIIPSIYLSHGFNTKSHIALASIFGATIIIAMLAAIFGSLLNLNGSVSEEAFYLQDNINLKSLLLGAIVLGALGVIDDIAMTQVSIVNELYHSNTRLSALALFKRAMQVGRDHIASVINTLFLAYVGVGLPLLVLLRQNNLPLHIAIQQETLATEIMRTLIGTIGLILVVPLATFIAAKIITRRPDLFPEHEHHHIH